MNKATEIWNNIKDLKISMFSLPAIPVSEYFVPKLELPMDFLYLIQKKTGPVVSFLEELLKEKYIVILQDNGFLEVKEK